MNLRQAILLRRLICLLALASLLICLKYVFWPILLCVAEWGEFAEDCQDTLFLALLIPTPIFLLCWGLLMACLVPVGKTITKLRATHSD